MLHTRVDILCIRALNHLRKIHIPSYVGLRLMLNSFKEKERRDKIILNYMLKYGITHKEPYFKEYKIFKSYKDGEIIHRECVTPSPTAALIESYIIDIISRDNTFAQSGCVYSYQFSHKNSGSNFQYYFDGYEKRNRAIHNALISNKDSVVLLFDIEKFYPSIDSGKALESFFNILAASEIDKTNKKNIEIIIKKMFGDKAGVPIGPALSHLIASYTLQTLDAKAQNMFGGLYFRYVDDIAVIVPKNAIDIATSEIISLIEDAGFKVNVEKTQYATCSEWGNDVFLDKNLREDLSSFWGSIYLKFLLYGEISEGLTAKFIELGFSIPFHSMKLQSKNPLLVRFYNYFFKYKVSISDRIFKSLMIRDDKFIDNALRIRDRAFIELEKLCLKEISNPIEQKKVNSAIRFLLSRLLYIMPINNYNELMTTVPKTDDYFAQRCIISDVLNNEIKETLKVPGPSTVTLGQLFQARNNKLSISGDNYNADEMDSLSTLKLLDVIEPQESLLDHAAKNMFHAFSFDVDFVNFLKIEFDYDNELYALRKQHGAGAIDGIMNSRFTDEEFIVFDGFNLGNSISGL